VDASFWPWIARAMKKRATNTEQGRRLLFGPKAYGNPTAVNAFKCLPKDLQESFLVESSTTAAVKEGVDRKGGGGGRQGGDLSRGNESEIIGAITETQATASRYHAISAGGEPARAGALLEIKAKERLS